jgi:hypothetical protein
LKSKDPSIATSFERAEKLMMDGGSKAKLKFKSPPFGSGKVLVCEHNAIANVYMTHGAISTGRFATSLVIFRAAPVDEAAGDV